MTDEKVTRRQQWAARDAREAESRQSGGAWGITYEADPRRESPERLAHEARERGDRWFQIDLPIAITQGHAYMGATATRVQRPETGDVIGRIEEQGWRLQHVAATLWNVDTHQPSECRSWSRRARTTSQSMAK
jgi:hypothetical protein